MKMKTCCFFLFMGLVLAAGQASPAQSDKRSREEGRDHFKKWLDEDVVYIISDQERAVFDKLTTAVEKENFVEQFWFRRDPDPTTAVNEAKEEHYRRIAYANSHFKSGIPGWKTDRGRVYITHGPPDSVETYPTGGTYQRPIYEGGGFTSTHPFELWRYHSIEGVGQDVELEFVDSVGGGEYRLALSPDEKDALLHVPGLGRTLDESLGLASKADRPVFSQNQRALMTTMRAKDSPFDRYETYSRVQAPAIVKYKDLKEIVNVNIAYSDLPMQIREDYFRLNERQVLVPITVQLANHDLTYKEDAGVHVARVAVYGVVTSINNRIVTEFEDELVSAYPPADFQNGLSANSVYQRILPLDGEMRYKIDLVVKDVGSGRVGVTRRALTPPTYKEEALAVSSLLLSTDMRRLPEIPDGNPMFVLGDIKIHPALGDRFQAGAPVGVYFQLYNAGFDQTTLTPSLQFRYRLLNDRNEVVLEQTDNEGKSVLSVSDRRVVVVKPLPVTALPPGRYRLEVLVHDAVSDQDLAVSSNFELIGSTDLAG